MNRNMYGELQIPVQPSSQILDFLLCFSFLFYLAFGACALLCSFLFNITKVRDLTRQFGSQIRFRLSTCKATLIEQ